MENILDENQPVFEKPVRPQFLTILCVLSYIWNGLVIFGLLIGLLFSNMLWNVFEQIVNGESEVATVNEAQIAAIQSIIDLGKGAFISIIAFSIIIYATSLLGVFKMWRLQKWGFYIYAAINGLGLIYDVMTGSFFMGIITLAFLIMYGTNLKYMR